MTERRSPQSKDPNAANPSMGGDQSRHAGKGNLAQPSGTTPVTRHTEKGVHDQACGRSGLANPSSGPTDRGKDPANISKPALSVEPIPVS
jgi:hypothetical protein